MIVVSLAFGSPLDVPGIVESATAFRDQTLPLHTVRSYSEEIGISSVIKCIKQQRYVVIGSTSEVPSEGGYDIISARCLSVKAHVKGVFIIKHSYRGRRSSKDRIGGKILPEIIRHLCLLPNGLIQVAIDLNVLRDEFGNDPLRSVLGRRGKRN